LACSFSSIFCLTFSLNKVPNPSLSNDQEAEVQLVAQAQTEAVFFHVACCSFFIMSESDVVDSRVTCGTLDGFLSGAASRSTFILGSFGSVTFNA
jgi:hypothetical protein